MSINWQYVAGTVTIVCIVGGSIYAIKKYKEQGAVMDQSITAEDARRMVEDAMEDLERSLKEEDPIDIEEMVDDIREEVDWNLSFTRPIEEINEQEEKEYVSIAKADEETTSELEEPDFTYDECNFEQPLAEIMTEEDKELKHPPNSNEARNQFIRMELAEWIPTEDTYQTMLNLFQFPFESKNDGDWDLKTKIIDYKAQFFGFGSRWTKEVTFADVILHFGRLAEYNVGETLRHWVDYFLEFNEFEPMTPSVYSEELINQLNSHVYFNEVKETFGLFGLNRYHMDKAIAIAQRNIDQSLTYEIEFNEFLKSCL